MSDLTHKNVEKKIEENVTPDVSKTVTEKKASENVTAVSDKVVADIQPVCEKSITQKVADGTQAELKTTVESAKDTVSNIVNAAVEKVQAAANAVAGTETKEATTTV